MARSKIIKDLIEEKTSLEEILLRVKPLLFDLDNTTILEWVNKEIEGYGKNDDIPEYRKYNISPTYSRTWIEGNLRKTLNDEPVRPEKVWALIEKNLKEEKEEYFKYLQEEFFLHKDRRTIKEIEKMANDTELQNGSRLSCSFMCRGIIENLHPEEKITKLYSIIPIGALGGILSKIKNKLLDALLTLEKEYGNLDQYDIFFGKSVEEKEKVAQKIIKIIMGDNNIITGSNLGETING